VSLGREVWYVFHNLEIAYKIWGRFVKREKVQPAGTIRVWPDEWKSSPRRPTAGLPTKQGVLHRRRSLSVTGITVRLTKVIVENDYHRELSVTAVTSHPVEN